MALLAWSCVATLFVGMVLAQTTMAPTTTDPPAVGATVPDNTKAENGTENARSADKNADSSPPPAEEPAGPAATMWDWSMMPHAMPMLPPAQMQEVVPMWNAQLRNFDWVPIPDPVIDWNNNPMPLSNCPPCQCHDDPPSPPQPPMMPAMMPPDVFRSPSRRARRSVDNSYWYSTGPSNPVLSQINMGYATQQQLLSQMGQIPLHMGTISKSDFNFPGDVFAFGRPVYGSRLVVNQWSADQFPVWSRAIYRVLEPVEAFVAGTNIRVTLVSGLFKFMGLFGNKDVVVRELKTSKSYVVDNCLDLTLKKCQSFQSIGPIADYVQS